MELPLNYSLFQSVVFELWQRSSATRNSDAKFLGRAVVGLHPLLLGFQEIAGWYHINDEHSQHVGQLKVCLH